MWLRLYMRASASLFVLSIQTNKPQHTHELSTHTHGNTVAMKQCVCFQPHVYLNLSATRHSCVPDRGLCCASADVLQVAAHLHVIPERLQFFIISSSSVHHVCVINWGSLAVLKHWTHTHLYTHSNTSQTLWTYRTIYTLFKPVKLQFKTKYNTKLKKTFL